MIKVENVNVCNFENAIRGMRNPYDSWDKSDSKKCGDDGFVIGNEDIALMKKLYRAGTEHRKYARQIFVSMDITAPLYWISEFDTYKIGVARNSCSFMHRGLSKPFEITDFSIHDERVYENFSLASQTNDVVKSQINNDEELAMLCYIWETTIDVLNNLRSVCLRTKDDVVFQKIRCLLPSGYNQRFTATMDYENVFSIINQRGEHKLDEWREFVCVLKQLPYIKKIIEK